MPRAFLIRKPNGELRAVIGEDVVLPCLPDYRFFAWLNPNRQWTVTECSTGGVVYKGEETEPLDMVLLTANTKVEALGREKATAVIAAAVEQFGEPLNERIN